MFFLYVLLGGDGRGVRLGAESCIAGGVFS